MAGNSRIKGITVEIGGETTGLQNALQDVNKRSNALKSELKDVERLLKFDPGNTEALAQKQRLLTEQIGATADKLETLKTAQQQAQQQFERGEITAQQFRALNREIEFTEVALNNMREELEELNVRPLRNLSNAANEAGENLKNAGQKMTDAGSAITTGLTAPILGVGAAAMKSAADMEKAFGKLAATTDRTKEDTEEMIQAARELWKNAFGEDINEAAEAIAIVDRNLGDLAENAEEVKKLTEQAFILKDAFGYEIQESSRAAAALMHNFGITGAEAFDMIATAAVKGGDFSQELIDTISEYSTYFGAAGISAERMFDILLAGAENGAWNLDKVGDAVKEFNIRAKDGSKTTAEGFKAIGFNADEMAKKIAEGGEAGDKAFMATLGTLASMDDKVKQTQAGVALFGTQWEDLESTVMQAMANSEGYLGDFSGRTAEMGDELYNNFGSKLTTTIRSLQDALVPIGETILRIVEQALPAIESMAQSFGNLPAPVQEVVLVVGVLLAAIGPIIVILGFLVSSIGTLVTAFGAVSGAIATAGGVMAVLTGPIGIIIASIVALIAVGVYLYKNWDDIKARAIILGEKFPFLKVAFNSIVDPIKNIINAGISLVKNWDSVKAKAGELRDKVMNLFKGIKWELPKIKLPHFRVSGSLDLNPMGGVSVPKVSVDWYKNGGVFPANSPRLIGIGDANVPEAALPLSDDVLGRLGAMISKHVGGGNGITIENMYVRNDDDIKMIARELNMLQKMEGRKTGVVF